MEKVSFTTIKHSACAWSLQCMGYCIFSYGLKRITHLINNLQREYYNFKAMMDCSCFWREIGQLRLSNQLTTGNDHLSTHQIDDLINLTLNHMDPLLNRWKLMNRWKPNQFMNVPKQEFGPLKIKIKGPLDCSKWSAPMEFFIFFER